LTLSTNDSQQKSTLRYADCRYSECHDYLNVMLSV
jgi:hypothetical protein